MRRAGRAFQRAAKRAITSAVEEGVLVVTGGPGTGKTTIIRCIISLLKAENDILLCAPTGRAAKRMSEATGEEARTIHRLLEYGGDADTFARGEDYPLEADCLIVDEMSMVDVTLMRGLLRAVIPGTRLILVGDADQLPSVGAGNVLSDILQSDAVPSVRLTDIFRQDESSMIVWNAHLINSGQMPVLRTRDTDFFFERKILQSEAARTIAELLTARLPRYLGYARESWRAEAVRSIQVLSPAKKGDCGAIALNHLLQDALNPEREGLVETPDRIARACRELFAGLQASPADVLEKHFDVDTDELVLVKDIELYSVCEHHLLPFHGVAHVGYIPAKDGVMGLSKLARLVEVYARRPQVQERLTQQIADALVEYAGARGVIVVTECEHLCMSMRGIKKSSARTVTSAVRGLLRNPPHPSRTTMSLILDK